HLVDLHDGSVNVESAGCGQGTTVCLTLPRLLGSRQTAVQASAPSASSSVEHALTGANVLVVDDDSDGGQMLELVLTAQGARVTRAASTREALAVLRASSVDVVLTDLSMPGDDGFTLLTQLRASQRAATPAIRVVAITAHARPEDREKCLA